LKKGKGKNTMTSKRNLILLVLLILQGALIAFVYLGGREKSGPLPALFPGLEPSAVQGLRIADREGGATVLEKGEEGWLISSVDGLPADPAKVARVLEQLAGLRGDRLVARTRESHGRFLVGENRYDRLLTLTLADGSEKRLYLGSSPAYKSTHARLEGEDRVYLLNNFASWEIPQDVSSWWLADYIDLADQNLQEVRLVNPVGSLLLVRDDGAAWRPGETGAGQSLDQARVQEFIDAARHISLSEYLGREELEEYGLASPRATLTLVDRDGSSITLVIGARDEVSGTYHLKSSASPFYARAGAAVLTPLLEARLERLLAGEKKEGL